jgi:hypothetical protein
MAAPSMGRAAQVEGSRWVRRGTVGWLCEDGTNGRVLSSSPEGGRAGGRSPSPWGDARRGCQRAAGLSRTVGLGQQAEPPGRQHLLTGLAGADGRFAAVGGTELVEDVRGVLLDRVERHVQLVGDVLVLLAGGQQV